MAVSLIFHGFRHIKSLKNLVVTTVLLWFLRVWHIRKPDLPLDCCMDSDMFLDAFGHNFTLLETCVLHTCSILLDGVFFCSCRRPRIFLIFVDFWIFLVDFGVREVSQWRDLEILLQVVSGRARDDFKMPRSGTGTFFEKVCVEDFLSKSISYASPRPTTTTEMTAIGFSCYGLFTQTIAFAAFLQRSATLLVKSHFFILSLPRSVLFWICLLC